jgi:HSP20 family protein
MNLQRQQFIRPAATVIENKEGFIVEADLPGVTREGLALTVENDTLTIRGHRNGHVTGARPVHRESNSLDYQRVFELGTDIDRNAVKARFEQGVLRIYLPKSEALKPRRVEVAG